MGQRLVIVSSPLGGYVFHSVSVEISRFCAVSTGEWAFLSPLDLSVDCRIQWRLFFEETFGGSVRVGSSSSVHG